MSSDDNLPAILVSAVDVATASEIITELISDGVEGSQINGAEHGAEPPEPAPSPAAAAAAAAERGVVWRLENKYYRARVRLLAAADRPARPAPPAPPGPLHAHLIYLTEDECCDESLCERRAEAAAGRLARGGVRLVGARCAAVAAPPRLRAWAAAARYELVPLAGEAGEAGAAGEGDDGEAAGEGDDGEAVGVARLREALHAHVWPGLVRRAPRHEHEPLYAADDDSSEDSSSSSWGSWRRAGEGEGAGEREEDEAGAVERAEEFAAALALLPAARGGAGGGGDADGEDDGARRLRAEQLLAAFCRALGHQPPPTPPPPR